MAASPTASRRSWAQKSPPLLAGVVSMLIAAFVLPSALNLPQTNPSQTLEYAPVPEDDQSAPHEGNVASLGLGTSSGALGDGIGGVGGGLLPPPVTAPTGLGTNPTQKRCVGNPPRQTEDPMAPPCVAFFDGDNGGATYGGVTKHEIRVLFYFDGGGTRATSSEGSEDRPDNQFDDLGKPPAQDEFVNTRVLRALQRFFNDRYQTYGRLVHFYVHYGKSDATPETRRADAAAAFARIHPFAVVSYPQEYSIDYARAMARYGVVNFVGRDIVSYEGRAGQPESFYRQFPGLVWSFDPTLDQRARLFTTFVCKKALGHRVSFSGNGDLGQQRVFGFLYNTDPEYPEVTLYAQMIKQRLKACGLRFKLEQGFPHSTPSICVNHSAATQNMAAFKQAGVTTVIWGGGMSVCQSVGAAQVDYYPEWLIPGDTVMDANIYARTFVPSVWQHARTISSYPRGGLIQEEPCYRATLEAAPETPTADMRFACGLYKDARQLFTGIQVAGPRLTPAAIDQGFHAIPPQPSTDPRREACYYDPDDYSCVKDAQVSWWDPTTPPPGRSEPGCWRLEEGGRRYLPGTWPAGDVEAKRTANDPCNGLNGTELS